MKKGQQIRNVSDVTGPGIYHLPIGATYILTMDASADYVFFKDDEGHDRMCARHRYELVQPENDKALTWLKAQAIRLHEKEGDNFDFGFSAAVRAMLRGVYGLDVKSTQEIAFVPING